MPLQAMEMVANLVNYFEENIIARPDYIITTHWYTLKLMDEYARLAHEQIQLVEQKGAKKLTLDDNEFNIDNWSSLSQCEMKTIKYQAIVNHLGNNLQCLASAAFITALADGRSENVLSYKHAYNGKLFSLAIAQLS